MIFFWNDLLPYMPAGLTEPGVPGLPQPQILVDQVTLSQPGGGGQIMPATSVLPLLRIFFRPS
jgi:hypothetical protein